MKDFPKSPTTTFEYTNSSGAKVKLDVSKDLTITEPTLQQCFETHAVFVSWYAALHRQAELLADITEDEFDQWFASVKAEMRKKLEVQGSKYTEKALDEAVMQIDVYSSKQRYVRQTRTHANTLKDFVTAWLERGRMLMKLGIQARESAAAEYQDPSVSKKKGKRLED